MKRKQTIGLLGGGQLGRMLQEAAGPLGIEIAVLDEADCPVRQINPNRLNVTGSFKDPDKIRELAARCDVLTVEIEHVNTEVLEEIATNGVLVGPGQMKKVPVHPSWETLRLVQDKYLQKEHFRKAGLPVAQQIAIEPNPTKLDALRETAKSFGFPFMLKARKGSYDGRGNFKVSSEKDLDTAVKSLGDLQLYAEKWVPFQKELAVLVVRTEDDDGTLRDVFPYPAVETIHEDSICSKVLYPPREVSPETSAKAREVASNVVRTLKGRGVFAVEMFLLEDNSILVNEVAPRPHNSGHLFIEAVPKMSQFKAQLYSILDILPDDINLEPRVSAAMMLNILGGAKEHSHEALVDMAMSFDDNRMDLFTHLYGKASKPGRKIGHITTTMYASDVNIGKLLAPMVKEVDRIRKDRLDAASAQAQSTNSLTQPSVPTLSSSRDPKNPLVVVTMGSDSDLPILIPAFETLDQFKVPYDYTITSAHRTPDRMKELAMSAAPRGIRVLIAAAGGAAHLPGMLASETTVPVIGVPIKAKQLNGEDSLLSMTQMPPGCPVAVVGINNSKNAALLAVLILGSSDERYKQAMTQYKKIMKEEVEEKARRLAEVDYQKYLGGK